MGSAASINLTVPHSRYGLKNGLYFGLDSVPKRGPMARVLKLSEDLRPVSELKARPGEVLDHVQRTGRPVVLTRHGKGVAVVMSLGAFEELEAASRREDLRAAVADAEAAYARGEFVDHDVVEAELTKWESGE